MSWRASARGRERGFTLVELLIALFLGTLVLGAAVAFLITHLRSLEGSDIRENVARNGRYIGVLLRRDVQLAGVDIRSTTNFGTLATWPGTAGDTLVILHVPYLPEPSPPRSVDPTANGGMPPPPGQGTCGDYCVDILTDAVAPLQLAGGDLARIQVGDTRRLIIIDAITATSPTQAQLTWFPRDTILRQKAGIELENVQLLPSSSFVQELQPIMYYLDDRERLMRASRINADASPDGEIVAFGVEQFELSLVFADGDEAETANPIDSDVTNDFDDIIAVKAHVTVKADRTDPRVNQGQLLRRTYEWHISPRNLRYEKNRLQ